MIPIENDAAVRQRSSTGRRAMVALGAAIPVLLYLFYVHHYSLNVPVADDWNVIPLASAAIHHRITLNQLWVQYGDTRLFVGFVFFALFGIFDHLNEKSIILFSAGVFIATFALLVLLFRDYLRRRLSFLSVLSLGIVWFSLADVQNSLWSFQLAWYFVLFGFMAMSSFLLIRHKYRVVFLVLSILAAVAASYAEVQGFVVWPVGLLCILWTSPWQRRVYLESATWALAAILTTAIYLHGFIFAADTQICVVEGGNKASCSLTFGLLHPLQLARFLLVLVGNVFPTDPGTYVVAHELLGAAILVMACWVVVQSIRERREQISPLPVALIAFAFLFDLMLALSRLAEGPAGAGLSRYTMPNIVLLAGIVVYAWAHPPGLSVVGRGATVIDRLKVFGVPTLIAFFVVQSVVATQYGVTNGSAFRAASDNVARVVVNLDRIPYAERACYFQSVVVGPPLSILLANRYTAIRAHLSLFRRDADARYLEMGPPRIARCDQPKK